RKRIAADTIGRAQEQAAQLRRDAERDAESIRTTARLEGKEQAHELMIDAERLAREKRQEVQQLEQALAHQRRELQHLAGITPDEARELLLRQIEADARRDAAGLVKRIDAEARESAAARARQMITEAIQRSAAEHAIETTVSVVDLPSDDMKGRIIGREGRNIRALELATGVELIVDDTPGAVILSSFDPLRREVARLAI